MISKIDYDYLRSLDDFRLFPAVEFDQLARQIKLRQAGKGQRLFFEGDAREHLFLVRSGYFKIEMADQSGSFYYMDFIQHGTIFPYGGLFTDEAYHFSALAMTDVVYYELPVQLYEEFSLGNTEQMKHLFEKISKLLELHELRVRNTVTSNAKDRVIQSLGILFLEMLESDECTLPFKLTTHELADMSGTTRETVSRVLKELKEDQKIQVTGKQVSYLDRNYFYQYTK
ncbi:MULTISPECIES: Crp/Fnr family transcriptional regulator [unclassified Streptococcus]|uniref:Crp/Fnr family transcriptional regulator n=1 Tax=unclassified Streptococcus TaxID=2608887 RepID=UPI0018AB2ECB|nr:MULTISPECIES: Crp/Fnr family transcriptional regulator [unclassified Streptococcus]MBF8970299.1 Crp/Fnr family transcriptional regulator [Streptococcus sp. NLN76]MBG9367467.1 Crp/Fnr family transcriptional regulator [Streptococcus sp. NLN64]MBJ6745587.1 Crp/Fnr family transcriptional regulator [Streptococcus sp. 121]